MMALISSRRRWSTRRVRSLTGYLVTARAIVSVVNDSMTSSSSNVVEAGEADAAFVAGRDLADVVLEATQRGDAVGGDELAVAIDAGTAAHDATVGHVAAGDGLAAPDAEDLAHLGTALDGLDDLWLEHAGEGGLHVLGELVDDVVEADLDALGLRGPAGRARRRGR